jgi:UDP-glucose 4-epimerase
VDNVVDANVLALASGASGVHLNIACGRSVSLLELVDVISNLSGRRLAVSHEPPRAGDVQHSRADCRLAEKVLGYRPRTQFDAGMASTYQHYQTH